MTDHSELPTPEAETPEAIVAANVRLLREALGISQTELAKRTTAAGHSLGDMAIWTIETGKRRIRVDDLFGLAEVLGVTQQQLLDPDCSRFPAKRQYEVWLDGDLAKLVVADTVEPDGQGWLNFYLRGDRVFFAAVPRVLCVQIGEPR